MDIEKEKKQAKREWWWRTYPLDILRYSTGWLLCIPAWILMKLGVKKNPLWYWLDDEIYNEETNKDWISFKIGKFQPWAWYDWHSFRNPMYNKRRNIKPEIARINCVSNDEEIVEIITDTLTRNGEDIDSFGLCYEEAILKFIDKNGNEGFHVFSGDKVSMKFSNLGELHYWFRANGKLYFRYSIAEIRNQWGFSWKFPFIVKQDYWVNIKKGMSEKGYTNTNKRKKVK